MSIGKALLMLGLLNFVLWSFKVTNHFLDYYIADEIGLLTCLVVPYLISRNFKGSKQAPYGVALSALLVITLLLHPILSFALQRTDYTWVIPNIVFAFIGILLGNTSFDQAKAAPLWLLGGMVWFIPFQFIPDQSLYFDRLVASTSTRQGKIHKVRWKGEQWVHYNGRLSAATIDAHLYYEPLVHPIMSLAGTHQNVLLMGGDNGLAYREIMKYDPKSLTVIPLDTEFFTSSIDHDFTPITEEPFVWLNRDSSLYDAIIVDLPDPINAHINQYYTLEFYEMCRKHLSKGGLLVTQASSPYFHATTHYSIKATLEAAGFQTINFHNQVPTIGQWGWVIGAKGFDSLKHKLENTYTEVTTRWWDQEAMQMMLSFGKSGYFDQQTPVINTIKAPLFHVKP